MILKERCPHCTGILVLWEEDGDMMIYCDETDCDYETEWYDTLTGLRLQYERDAACLKSKNS